MLVFHFDICEFAPHNIGLGNPIGVRKNIVDLPKSKLTIN
jgi:hypothetical protein